ncbi:Phage tail assembly chaperone protein [uncultured Caudovirales phage]|uniref:Phage tail assembly chaperone protein n=1 Tax=uncultured Caudovirales phage TaxID=2100421 RepID=A0A6J5LUH1_9CAUD|nr:Phage tail assembly chaperone protein [uncultured Caudovirales phage]CAB4151933.1 Phage tail assembly chaperone protein [uncultured Caudovirales phage]CAB4166767.1 Phage tail assembly chaperone protein [uncultured Caudovirales phage]
MPALNSEAEDARIRSGPHKVVNGDAVALTPDEIAEHNARTAAAVAARPAQALAELRAERNALLAASDWTQAPDAPTANAAAWKVYRQALRDLPQRTTYPNAPQWPTAP